MKRSEVVDIIAEYLKNYQNCGNEKEEADNLLVTLESLGMLPPLIEKMEDGRFVGSSSALYPEWEEE